MSTKHWVLIELKNLEKDINAVKLFGSITKLVEHGIWVYGADGEKHPLTYNSLRNRISKKRYWRNSDYVIKECQLLTSKRKIEEDITTSNNQNLTAQESASENIGWTGKLF